MYRDMWLNPQEMFVPLLSNGVDSRMFDNPLVAHSVTEKRVLLRPLLPNSDENGGAHS